MPADQYGDNHDAGADHASHSILRAGASGGEFWMNPPASTTALPIRAAELRPRALTAGRPSR